MPGVEKTKGEWLEPVLENDWVTGKGLQGPGLHPPPVFTLPEGYRPLERPRHYLVIHPPGPEVSPSERYWEIEHDPSCSFNYSVEWVGRNSVEHLGHHAVIDYTCDVADEVGYFGLDYLDADWAALSAGRYEIEAWHTEYDGGYDPRECEHGLRVVRCVPTIVATVVSV